jgi:hypothetical protein
LRAQIDRLPLGRDMTVGRYLKKVVTGREILPATLERAEMVGGPRWIDDQTVQVRLEINGQRVKEALIQISALQQFKSPYTPAFIAEAARAWENQVFTANGTSGGAAVVERVRPAAEDVNWASVNDQTRRDAIAAARASADQRILDSLKPIQLAGGKTVGDVLANAAINDEMRRFLDSRPVSGVQFGEDRQVKVTLGVRPDEVYQAFRAAAVRAGAMPPDESAWFNVRDLFARQMAEPVGFSAPSPAPRPAQQQAAWSDQPPEWIRRQIDASATAVASASQLRSARVAETDAMRKLRAQLEALPLAKDVTVGSAAQSDPRIAEAIERTMDHARLYKVDYHEDGSVTAYVSVETMGLWGEISRGR